MLQFANSDGEVMAHDRISGKTQLLHVKVVAAESELYTIEDIDGNPTDAFETGPLGRIDGRIASLLPKLLEPSPALTTDERIAVDGFFAMQHARSPSFRDFLADAHDLNLRATIEVELGPGASNAEIEQFIDKRFPEATERGRAEIRRLIADPSLRAELLTIDWLEAIRDTYPDMIEVMVLRPWVFVTPEQGVFLTSDNPVVMIDRYLRGLETARTIFWPFSPHRALWRTLPGVHDRRKPRNATVAPEQLAQLNQLTAHQAKRHVIWHPGTSPDATVEMPTGPYLRSVNGLPVGPGESSYDKIRQEVLQMRDALMDRHARSRHTATDGVSSDGTGSECDEGLKTGDPAD